MNYPLSSTNLLCRMLGHRWRRYTDSNGVPRKTCSLDGLTIPPFRKIEQHPPYAYLPDSQQPPGAM